MVGKLRALLHSRGPSLGLMILRVSFGLFMAINHGWPKLAGFAEKSATFADPLGVGSRVSLGLAVFGELVCAGLVAVGLFTRPAAAVAAVTMLVAAFGAHGDDPFGKGEHALLFAAAFVAVSLTGPGRVALDALMPRARPHNIFRS